MISDQEVITNDDLVKNIKLHKYYHTWFKDKEKQNFLYDHFQV